MKTCRQLPKRFQDTLEPECYRVNCPKCNHVEVVELANPNQECDSPGEVTELPKVCPACGGALTKKRIPVIVRY